MDTVMAEAGPSKAAAHGQQSQQLQVEQQAASASRQAQRLMSKLEACDGQLALLLEQAADSLAALLERSRQASNAASSSRTQAISLADFEDVAQDWLASIFDIQLTLRKAIRFLVRASHPPVMTASHSFVPGGGISAVEAGTAADVGGGKAKAEGEDGTARRGGGGGEGGHEDGEDLSLSATRLRHRAWQDIVASLRAIKAAREASQGSQGAGAAAGADAGTGAGIGAEAGQAGPGEGAESDVLDRDGKGRPLQIAEGDLILGRLLGILA